jgi:hypothetical protein
VSDGGLKIGRRLILGFDRLHEAVESLETTYFVATAEFGCVERRLKDGKRLIVGFERNWKRMPIFATKREREASRI